MAGRKKHTSKRVITYKTPDILVRVPKPDFEYDHALAEEIMQQSLVRGLSKAPPKGVCYECGKAVPPGRKLCGRCNSHRELDRHIKE